MFHSPRQTPLLPYLRRSLAAVSLAAVLIGFAGCSHFHPISSPEYVYVTAKHMYLRDRVAVVANRVGEVTNGERLQVLEHGRRFLRVKTPGGAAGWIEDHAVIGQNEYDEFQQLAKQQTTEKPVANAVLYNELYVHLAPGRKTQRFYLLPPNAKVSLLQRASVPKSGTIGVLGLAKPASTASDAQYKPALPEHRAKSHKQSFESQLGPAAPMEDWWLVRDTSGRTGWVLSRDLEVDVPQDVAQYAENEKMIGAYVLRTVDDPDSGKSDGKVPEYLTVLTPYKQGLPYDFDQVRVFTWDTRHHRYGTAFRLRNVAGFFPVKVVPGDANGSAPMFYIQAAPGNSVSLNPQTGQPQASQLEALTFRMEGNLIRRVGPASAVHTSEAKTADHSRRSIRHRSRRHHR